jgi:hypothetical protein
MATRMQQRRGTAAQWISTNSGNGPILNAGEIGYESDTNKFKIGDGTNHWINLDYFTDANSTVNPSFGSSITFEGATDNNFETTVLVTDPTADRTITLPNATGTVAFTSDIPSSTTALSEGTNLYFTDERAQDAVGNSVGTGLSYNDSTGAISVTANTYDAYGAAATAKTGAESTASGYVSTHANLTETHGATGAVVGTTNTQTLTNKTLTSPVINTPTGITKTDVGLSSVDNTTDANKPVSTATQTALDLKAPLASPTFTGTVSLDTGVNLVFEGATADAYETTLTVVDPTADRTITFPNATGTVVLADGNGNVTISGDVTVNGVTTVINSTVLEVQNEIKFEGTTADAFETSLKVVDPTADRTITFPNATGTVVLADATQTLDNKSINLNGNTVTGTIALFNTALSDADFATLAGTETLTNKTLTTPNINEAVALTATATELNVLDGVTSSTAELNLLDGVTSSTAELNILDGVTATAAELNLLDGVTSSTAELNILDGVTATAAQINVLASLTSSATELNILDGVTATTAEINKLAGVTATSAEINTLSGLTSTAAELNILDGATLSVTELNYVDGVTSAIQTQLDAKQAVVANVSDTEIGYLDGVTSSIQTQLNGKQATVANVSDVEIGYLDGVTSSIQTQMDAKAPLASPTFTGTVTLPSGTVTSTMILDGTIANADINASAAIDWTKIAPSSTVSATELGYLDGVTSAIQTQLDAKAALSAPTFTGTVTSTNDVVVNGNLTVNGTTFNASSTSITIEDNMLQLAHQNSANTVDLGIVVGYTDGTAKHAGFVRDVSDAKWKLFKDVATEPATTVAFGEGSLDALAVGALEATTVTPSSGVVFSDGTQTLEGTPSRTPIIQKTASYTLSALTERDSLIEVASASGTTITIPLNSAVAYPVGTSIDILQTSTGQVTIAGDAGVTVNSTPGLKLRTQWSTATLFKRATNTWVVYGDLTA